MMEYQSIKLLNRENVVRGQKAENQLFKKLGRKKKYVSETKKRENFRKQLDGVTCCCKKVKKDKNRYVRFDLVRCCQLLTLE